MSDTQDTPQAIVLTEDETAALSLLICILQLNAADWELWDNVPELSEAGVDRLGDAVEGFIKDLRRRLCAHEIRTMTNAHEILGRVS